MAEPKDMKGLSHVVCKEHLNRGKYEYLAHVKNCEDGHEIKSQEECEEAGQAVGGWLNGGHINVGEWG